MSVIAILCSDLHLSETAPVARAAEPNWFDAQHRPLVEIGILSAEHECPIIVAGDVFDRWNASPAIINFALDCLPNHHGLYAIPGQHDLPNHNMNEIKRSAYWTLVASGQLVNLNYRSPQRLGKHLIVHGFAWKEKIMNGRIKSFDRINLAVSHQYVYTLQGIRGDGYPGAPKERMLSSNNMQSELDGWNTVVFGDNHKGFLANASTTRTKVNVMNCGTMMRRKQDERDYKPQVGLLKDDGTIDRHFLDVSKDVFSDPVEVLAGHGMDLDSAEFMKELKSLGGDSLDFRAAIMRRLDQCADDVRCAVLEVMDAVGER